MGTFLLNIRKNELCLFRSLNIVFYAARQKKKIAFLSSKTVNDTIILEYDLLGNYLMKCYASLS